MARVRSSSLISFLLGLFSISVASGTAQAEDITSLFDEACDLYEGGDFASALEGFESLAAKGVRSAAVYYNLGNCHYKQGSIGMAVANYRRALMLTPRDEDIRENLNLIRAAVGTGDTTGTYGLGGLVRVPVELLSPKERQLIFYFAYYLAAVSLLFSLFLNGRARRISLYCMISLLGLTAIAFGLSSYGVSRFYSNSEGVVIADQAELKSGPGNAFDELTRLSDGVELRLRARSGIWIEVELPYGEIGWVREKDIERI